MDIGLPSHEYVDEIGNKYCIIASAYISDDEIGYLLLSSVRPHYVYIYIYENGYGTTNERHRKTFDNIVPAVKHYHEQTGCY